MMEEDDDGMDEGQRQAMAILQARSDASNEFFMRVGEEILNLAKINDLTVNELAVSVGWLAGMFAVTAIKASPDNYEQAINEWVILCDSGVELAVACAQVAHEEALPGPSNG
jgi:hypothetical protein